MSGMMNPQIPSTSFPCVNSNDGKTTMVISSYSRWDCLQRCIDSFLAMNRQPIERIVVVEDSMNRDMAHKFIDKYGDKVDFIFNAKRIGQSPSLDRAYRTVYTQFILHTEDDYEFDGNGNFLKEAAEILNERQDIHQIWLRHWDDYLVDQGHDQFEDTVQHTSNNIPYKMLKVRDWTGFSWNAAFKRTKDYLTMFPEGYGKFRSPEWELSGVQTEARCQDEVKQFNYRGALLLNGSCYNRGKSCPTYP